MPGKASKRTTKVFEESVYASLIARARKARKPTEKGRALEDLLEYLFSAVRGLEVQARDFRGPAEELDLVIWNQTRKTVFASWDPVFFVECKNWSTPVGVVDLVVFIDKLRRVGLRNGVLVARNGITGAAHSDARLLLREALRDGIRITVITMDELVCVRELPAFLALCKGKYCRAFLSQL